MTENEKGNIIHDCQEWYHQFLFAVHERSLNGIFYNNLILSISFLIPFHPVRFICCLIAILLMPAYFFITPVFKCKGPLT